MSVARKNVLYLQSALGESHARSFDAVRRFAADAAWNVFAVHYAAAEKSGIDPGCRGEALNLAQFAALSDAIVDCL